jgi:hypothetical protein
MKHTNISHIWNGFTSEIHQKLLFILTKFGVVHTVDPESVPQVEFVFFLRLFLNFSRRALKSVVAVQYSTQKVSEDWEYGMSIIPFLLPKVALPPLLQVPSPSLPVTLPFFPSLIL